MTTVIFYPDGPQCPETSVATDTLCLAEWVIQAQHSGILPSSDVHIWRGQIANETHLTAENLTDELLSETDVTFHVSEKPCGPETWIPLIVSIVVGVAAAVLFTPDVPIPSATNSNQTSNNAISQRTNKPRINQRLPDIRGKEPYAVPDLWMSYNKFKRNQEYEVSLMCLSTGQVEVPRDTVKDGDTQYINIPNASVEIYGPHTSPNSGDAPQLRIGDPITDMLYEVRRSNEVDGVTLRAPNDNRITEDFIVNSSGLIRLSDPEKADMTASFQVGDMCDVKEFYSFVEIPEAQGTYNRINASDGPFRVTNVSKAEITLDVSSSTGWTHFDPDEQALLEQAYQSNDYPDIWRFSSATGFTLREWVPFVQPTDALGVGPFDVSGYPEVWLNLVAQNGLYKRSNNTIYMTVEFQVLFRDTSASPGPDVPYTISMSSNEQDSVQTTSEFMVPYENCSITVTRITDTDKQFEGTVIDEVKWRDLYTVRHMTKRDFGDLTTVFAVTRATDSALRQKERKFNCEATRVITRPDGSRLASDHFADVVYSLHTDPFIGRRTGVTIDHTGLYALQTTIQNYFGTVDAIRCGYSFDDDSYRYEDHLTLICGAVNVTPYQVGSQIKFFFEQPQAISVQQFGHRSKVPPQAGGQERRNRAMHPRNDYDGIELSYKDEVTNQFETIYMPSNQSATNPDVVEYLGCITSRMAKVRCDRLYQKLQFQRITHEFDALDKARLLAQGQRVDVIDNTRYTGTDGYVVETTGLEYVLSQPVNIGEGDWSIILTKRDGALEGIPVTASQEDDSVMLQYPPSEAAYVGDMADKTEYNLSTDDLRTSLSMLVDTIDPAGVDNVKVTCINYDNRYYDGDLTPLQ